MSTTFYLISCLFRTVLILFKMVTQLVVLILRREHDWMLILLLIDRHSNLILFTCVILILTNMVIWIVLLFLWGRYVFNVFLHRLIADIQTLFSSPFSSRTCWPLAPVSIRWFRRHTAYRSWTLKKIEGCAQHCFMALRCFTCIAFCPQSSSFFSLGRLFAAVLVNVPTWCVVSIFFWRKQIAGIPALVYYIPCTFFSPFSDLLHGGKQSLQEWTTAIAVHLV